MPESSLAVPLVLCRRVSCLLRTCVNSAVRRILSTTTTTGSKTSRARLPAMEDRPSQRHSPRNQTEPRHSTRPADSPSPPQVSGSAMPPQSPIWPRSPPTPHPSSPITHPWQTIKKGERPHPLREKASSNFQSPFTSPNQFAELSHLPDDNAPTPTTAPPAPTSSVQAMQPRPHTPPPIYVYNVTNYCDMVKYITAILEEEQYYCKALPNETVKINVHSPDSYRRLIKQLQEDKIIHHTYQIREERAYRVVFRHLHHSIPPHEIQAELEALGHKVRNVLNIRHRVTKEPLPLYFVDLEPQDNNKSIYDLQLLCNMKIAVEPPRKKNHIVQCTRCQSYGHTKTYCSRPFACVKCGGKHKTTLCTKDPADPATCALCGGDHPASYKGCTIYKNIQQARGKILRPPHPTVNPTPTPPVTINDAHQFPPLTHSQPSAPAASPYIIFPCCHSSTAAGQHIRSAVHLSPRI